MTWNIDKTHSDVGFSVRHMMISNVRGKFTRFDAEVELDPKNLDAAKVRATVETASVDTGVEARDNHLRSADFFDSEKHPNMTFTSTKVKQSGSELAVTGKLAIRGIEHEVTLKGELEGPAKDPWGNQRLGFTLSGEIEREQWGLTWNQALEAGGVMVAKKVKIAIETQLIEKA
jgi:polyisoprenoid-binding protein YceI